MKKSFIWIWIPIILLFTVAVSFGKDVNKNKEQVKETKGITGYGAKLGLNFSTVSGSHLDKTMTKTGIILGGFATYSLNKRLAIQPEIYYTMKGAKFEDVIWPSKYKLTWSLNYLEIPVLARYNFLLEDNLRAYAFGGPSMDFRMGTKYEEEWSNQEDEGEIKHAKFFDLGLIIGAGLDYPLMNHYLIFDIRYNLGLTNFHKVTDNESAEVKHRVLSILLGVDL